MPNSQSTCSPAPHYEKPSISHRGVLKHFAGSPLAISPNRDPNNVLGLPGK